MGGKNTGQTNTYTLSLFYIDFFNTIYGKILLFWNQQQRELSKDQLFCCLEFEVTYMYNTLSANNDHYIFGCFKIIPKQFRTAF